MAQAGRRCALAAVAVALTVATLVTFRTTTSSNVPVPVSGLTNVDTPMDSWVTAPWPTPSRPSPSRG